MTHAHGYYAQNYDRKAIQVFKKRHGQRPTLML